MCQIGWGDKFGDTSQPYLQTILSKNKREKIQGKNLLVLSMAVMMQFGIIAPMSMAQPLPPPDDTPEEILRTEIYTEARSPIDGSPLTAAEYIELQEELSETIATLPPNYLVSERVQEVIRLLKLRKFLRQIIPFMP